MAKKGPSFRRNNPEPEEFEYEFQPEDIEMYVPVDESEIQDEIDVVDDNIEEEPPEMQGLDFHLKQDPVIWGINRVEKKVKEEEGKPKKVVKKKPPKPKKEPIKKKKFKDVKLTQKQMDIIGHLYPKEYYDASDVEIDDKDGKEYVYFNIQKTLRKNNMLFITKIIPIGKLEKFTYDNDMLDKLAGKQHEKAVMLNSLTPKEQFLYDKETKKKRFLTAIGTFAAIGVLMVGVVIPNIKFNSAINLMYNKQYELAYTKLVPLGNKYDAAIYTKFCEGNAFLNAGKELSAGSAGQETQQENNVEKAIEKYNSAKECFKLIEGYGNYFTEYLEMSEEDANALITHLKTDADYNMAIMLYQNKKYEDSAAIFKEIHEYEEATSYYYKCIYEQADDLYEGNDLFGALAKYYIVAEASYGDSAETMKNIAQSIYDEATVAYKTGDYELAIENFAFLAQYEFLDSEDMIFKCRYKYALDFFHEKRYEKAIFYLEDIEEYKDAAAIKKECIYKLGTIAYNQRPVDSIIYFNSIPKYKNTDEILQSANLTLYGEWNIIELDGNAIQETTFKFNGDGLFFTSSANVLGVEISTDATQYKYTWKENAYVSEDGDYKIKIEITTKDDINMICSSKDSSYIYRCIRTAGYLDMEGITEEEKEEHELSMNEQLALLIQEYIDKKTQKQ